MKIIENISYSQLSIARYYGGANIDMIIGSNTKL